VRDSSTLERMRSSIGATVALNASAKVAEGSATGYLAMIDQLVRGILVPVEV
jgi:hypothetical protein